MSFLRKLAPWISRVALLPTIGIFTMIGSRHLLHPTTTAAAQAVAFTAPLGFTDFRVGFGAFPLGSALFLLLCLVVRSWALAGLVFAGLMLAVIVLIRGYGMEVDATVTASTPVLIDEIILFGVTLIGAAAEFYRLTDNRRRA